MAYHVEISAAAKRDIKKLPREAQQQVLDRLTGLEADPRARGCEQLTGPDHLYRVRTGDYRIIHQIRDADQKIVVAKVGHRRDVYRA